MEKVYHLLVAGTIAPDDKGVRDSPMHRTAVCQLGRPVCVDIILYSEAHRILDRIGSPPLSPLVIFAEKAWFFRATSMIYG